MVGTGKLRIMIVDDSAETREYLRKLLDFEQHLEIVGMAANGRDAVQLALEMRPDLVLMDINMPVMDGISAAEILFRELPSVRVVMMSVQSEMAYLRRAMQVGAREFLIKPFTHEELLNILGEVSSLKPIPAGTAASAPASETRVAAPDQALKLGTLVSVFSPRGGSGCSTIALNLALALHGQRKAQSLLIDASLRFGALDAMLNLQATRSIIDLLQSLDDADPELLHSITLPHTSGLRLLAAPPSPEMADMVLVRHLEKIVALGQRRYDYLVVDIGNSLDERALYFMDASQCIFVLLKPDIPAIKNVRLFLDVAQSLDYEPEKLKLVLNQAPLRGGINAEAIQRHLKYPIVASIPDSARLAQAAINRGVPLILYEREVHKQIPVTRQLLAITDIVPEPGISTVNVGAVPENDRANSAEPAPSFAPKQQQRSGFLSRLFGRGA
jgi:pilus assembly protein CpaE